MAELLPSGRQTVFVNRIGWARTYLKKAGLIDSQGEGQAIPVFSNGLFKNLYVCF